MKSDIDERLKIQRATEANIEDILSFEARNQQWFAQFLPQKVLEKQNKQYFQTQISDTRNTLQYLIYHRHNNVIGRFCVQLLDRRAKSVEISYRIGQSFTKQGIARYVLRRLLVLFSCYGVQTVYAYVGDGNEASIRLLLSCGFSHTATDTHSIKLPTGIQDKLSFKWENSAVLL
ncbi:hypothetical protein GCM10009112_27330 [Marinomonas arenicola]|uniref:GNAT family N-acetyltransferase n=1 Tax=Marinomonas TaxID=28253 RepID=UPI0010553CF0|nr:GNAT family N-acetyltransferase [Marinomonas sp. KMM3893]